MSYADRYTGKTGITEIELLIERLFALQDRPLPEKKRMFLVNEISQMKAPYEAIKQGIEKLYDKDVKDLRFKVIQDSILSCTKQRERSSNCGHCGGSGLVSMLKSKGCSYSFACICSEGQIKAEIKDKSYYPRWNGLPKQVFKDVEYTNYIYNLIGEKQYMANMVNAV